MPYASSGWTRRISARGVWLSCLGLVILESAAACMAGGTCPFYGAPTSRGHGLDCFCLAKTRGIMDSRGYSCHDVKYSSTEMRSRYSSNHLPASITASKDLALVSRES